MEIPVIVYLLVLLAYIYIFGIIYIATYLRSTDKVSGELARKFVHLGIGFLVVLAPLLFNSNLLPTLIGVTFIVFTFFTSPISPVPRFRLSAFERGHGMGTVYYSITLTILLFFFFDKPWVIQAGFLPLVFGDAFAMIIGMRYGQHKWSFVPSKSIEGSLGGFGVTFVVLSLVLVFYDILDKFPGMIWLVFVVAFLESMVATIAELLSPYGLDNLTIPTACTSLALFLETISFNLILLIA